MSEHWQQGAAGQQDLVGVVRLGKRDYATSLIWNGAEESQTLLSEARESAARMGTGLICLRTSGAGVPQYGLGDVLVGHKPGLPSLAAAVADASPGSLYGAWQTAAGLWLVIGVRGDGSVAYDKAFADEDAARTEFYDGMAIEPWEELVAPLAWQVPGAKGDDDLTQRFRKVGARLRPLKTDWVRPVLVLASGALLIGAGWFGWQKFNEEMASNVPEFMQAPPPVEPPPMPWADKPLPGDALRACVSGLERALGDAHGIPGWERRAGRCDGASITVDIERTTGTDNWLAAMGPRLATRPEVAPAADGKSTLNWRLPAMVVYAPDSPGSEVGKVSRYLKAHFAELFVPIELTPGAQQPFWNSLQFAFEAPRDPQVFLPLLAPIPGLTIDEVAYDPAKQVWSVKGQVYERRQPTPEELKQMQKQR